MENKGGQLTVWVGVVQDLQELLHFAKQCVRAVSDTVWYYRTSFEDQLNYWNHHIQDVRDRREDILHQMQRVTMPNAPPNPQVAQLFANLTCELDEMRKNRNFVEQKIKKKEKK